MPHDEEEAEEKNTEHNAEGVKRARSCETHGGQETTASVEETVHTCFETGSFVLPPNLRVKSGSGSMVAPGSMKAL